MRGWQSKKNFGAVENKFLTVEVENAVENEVLSVKVENTVESEILPVEVDNAVEGIVVPVEVKDAVESARVSVKVELVLLQTVRIAQIQNLKMTWHDINQVDNGEVGKVR